MISNIFTYGSATGIDSVARDQANAAKLTAEAMSGTLNDVVVAAAAARTEANAAKLTAEAMSAAINDVVVTAAVATMDGDAVILPLSPVDWSIERIEAVVTGASAVTMTFMAQAEGGDRECPFTDTSGVIQAELSEGNLVVLTPTGNRHLAGSNANGCMRRLVARVSGGAEAGTINVMVKGVRATYQAWPDPDPVAPLAAEDFESGGVSSGWNASGGIVIDQASALAGTYGARCTAVAGGSDTLIYLERDDLADLPVFALGFKLQVKGRSSGNRRVLRVYGGGGTATQLMSVQSNANGNLFIAELAGASLNGDYTLPLNTTVDLLVVYDAAGTATLAIDGIDRVTGTHTETGAITGVRVGIPYVPASDSFDVVVDDVAVFDRDPR